jgi:hypothetical protein
MKIKRLMKMVMCLPVILIALATPTWEINYDYSPYERRGDYSLSQTDDTSNSGTISVRELGGETTNDGITTLDRGADKMYNKTQLRDLITRVLKEANLYSESAVELLMLTAACESKLGTYLRQVRGPAMGAFQMEPFTHDDIWKTHGNKLSALEIDGDSDKLEYDLKYAILMSRMHYLRIPAPLPEAHDVDGLAQYWKKYYNTHLGKGTVAKAKSMYERYAV